MSHVDASLSSCCARTRRTASLLSPAPLRSFFLGASLFPGAQGNISRRTRHLSPQAVACRPCNGSVDEGGRRHLSRAPPCSPTRSRGRQTQSDRSQPLCPPGQLPLPNARRDQRLKRKPRRPSPTDGGLFWSATLGGAVARNARRVRTR